MKQRDIVWAAKAFAWLLMLLTGANCSRAGTYSVTDLGVLTDLSGRTDAKPNGINAAGFVAGANVVSGAYRAVLYSGAWTNLGTLGGAESLGSGLNASNQVIGSASTTSGETHAFLWTPGGTDGVADNPQMKDLGTLGVSASQADGINRFSQVTGYSDVSVAGKVQQHAFLYTGGTMNDIGKLLSGLPNSFGYGINASGHVTGTAYNANYSQPHAFFYNGTTAVDIGSLGGLGATALGINDGDHIVGYYDTTNSTSHAFHYFGGTMTDLGTLGGDYSYGIGINNSNVVVGGSFVDVNNSIYRAFIWSNNALADLNNLLDASGAGWTLVEARAINDAGQIVGTATHGGVNHAFLLTPSVTGLPAPTITGAGLSGPDVIISFTTISTATYALQTSDAVPSNTWSNVLTGVLGTGSTVSVTNLGGAGLSRRFYRVSASSL
jgi:probable HAF family extracellular repeat protein